MTKEHQQNATEMVEREHSSASSRFRYIPFAIILVTPGVAMFLLSGWDLWDNTWRLPSPLWWLGSLGLLLLITLLLGVATLWRAARPSATSPFRLIWSCLLFSTAWFVASSYLFLGGIGDSELDDAAVTGMLSFILSMFALIGLNELAGEDPPAHLDAGQHTTTGWTHYGGLLAMTASSCLIALVLAAQDYAAPAAQDGSETPAPASPALVAILLGGLAVAVLWWAYRPLTTFGPYLLIWGCIAVAAAWPLASAYLHPTDGRRILVILPLAVGGATFTILRQLSRADTRRASVSQ